MASLAWGRAVGTVVDNMDRIQPISCEMSCNRISIRMTLIFRLPRMAAQGPCDAYTLAHRSNTFASVLHDGRSLTILLIDETFRKKNINFIKHLKFWCQLSESLKENENFWVKFQFQRWLRNFHIFSQIKSCFDKRHQNYCVATVQVQISCDHWRVSRRDKLERAKCEKIVKNWTKINLIWSKW
jgi:hypothetical protein